MHIFRFISNQWVYILDSTTYWRCKEHDCKASITTNDDDNEILSRGGFHEHLANDDIEVEMCRFRNRAESRAANPHEIRLQLRDIYTQEFREIVDIYGTVIAKKFPEFEKIKATLARRRRLNTPKLPNTVEDINLNGDYISMMLFLSLI